MKQVQYACLFQRVFISPTFSSSLIVLQISVRTDNGVVKQKADRCGQGHGGG